MLYKEEITKEKLKIVWKSPLASLREKGTRGLSSYKLLSAALAVTMIILYVAFTFLVK